VRTLNSIDLSGDFLVILNSWGLSGRPWRTYFDKYFVGWWPEGKKGIAFFITVNVFDCHFLTAILIFTSAIIFHALENSSASATVFQTFVGSVRVLEYFCAMRVTISGDRKSQNAIRNSTQLT